MLVAVRLLEAAAMFPAAIVSEDADLTRRTRNNVSPQAHILLYYQPINCIISNRTTNSNCHSKRNFPVTSLIRATGAGPIPKTVLEPSETCVNPLEIYFECPLGQPERSKPTGLLSSERTS
jgi:hypothetical protein